jgi:hypothetical protein
MEVHAKCRPLKILTCKGTLRQVFTCLRPRTPIPPPPHCRRVSRRPKPKKNMLHWTLCVVDSNLTLSQLQSRLQHLYHVHGQPNAKVDFIFQSGTLDLASALIHTGKGWIKYALQTLRLSLKVENMFLKFVSFRWKAVEMWKR